MPTRGLSDSPSYDLSGVVLQSWDAFIGLVADVDLSAGTRLGGWSIREVVLHLGTWDGQSALNGVLESRRASRTSRVLDPDAFNRTVVDAHREASDQDVRAALAESRTAVAKLLASDEAQEHGEDLVSSSLGPMPLLTVVHAGCYELAVHALDVTDAIDGSCPPELLRHGIAALTDSTGCLAARGGIEATIGINATEAPWSFTAHRDGSWLTARIEGDRRGPRVSGSAKNVLEASAGRADPVRLVALRHLKVKHLGGLLALTPVIDQVPGLPGGRRLKGAAKSLGGLFNR